MDRFDELQSLIKALSTFRKGLVESSEEVMPYFYPRLPLLETNMSNEEFQGAIQLLYVDILYETLFGTYSTVGALHHEGFFVGENYFAFNIIDRKGEEDCS